MGLLDLNFDNPVAKKEEADELLRFGNMTFEALEEEYTFSKTLDTGGERELASTKLQLSKVDEKILYACEQYFWTEGSLPTANYLALSLGYSEDFIDRKLATRTLFAAMLKMGLPVSAVMTEDGLRASLTPTQLLLANMLMNALDPSSLREKLKIVDVTPQQYERWIRQPAFQTYLRRRAEEVFKGSDHRAYMKLLEAMDRGDLKAIQMVLEMRGIYNPKINVNFSVDGMLNNIIEVVAKYVSPEILEQIANELEGVSPTPVSTGSTSVSAPTQKAIEVNSRG